MTPDVVVVGAGSSGCALAAGLSADPGREVLLLEAGPSGPWPGVLSDPLMGSPARMTPERTWRYEAGPLEVVRGRGVGGSSVVNGAFFLRGLPEDYQAFGSPLWSWSALLPAFRDLEADRDYADGWHGTRGPVPVERMAREEWSEVHRAFHDGALAAGFPAKPDMNNPRGEGVGAFPRNVRDGQRVGADEAYLARPRPNLTIRADAEAVRVIIRDGRAIGVQIAGGEVIAAGEVILCAGALESPRLLWRSGVDLPDIGKHLRDHPAVVVPCRLERGVEPATVPHQVVLAYSATDRNDMQMLPAHAPDGVRVVVGLQAPRSVGELTPDGVRFNYLDDPEDEQRLVDGVRLAARILADGPVRVDVADVAAWVRRALITFQHTTGTCAMGPVVDDHGRVHGVEGLRVADLSIVPGPLRANPNATAFLIGERMVTLCER